MFRGPPTPFDDAVDRECQVSGIGIWMSGPSDEDRGQMLNFRDLGWRGGPVLNTLKSITRRERGRQQREEPKRRPDRGPPPLAKHHKETDRDRETERDRGRERGRKRERQREGKRETERERQR